MTGPLGTGGAPVGLARWQPALAAALAWAWVSALAVDAGAADFRARSFALDNGLQVVVIADHRAPIATQMVWYKVGSADDPSGKSGIAHVLEHLMFKGTKRVPAGEFSKIVARNGGRDNAFTSSDYTAYFQNVAVDRLELVMKLEADRMAGLAIEAESFAPELKVVIEERRMRIDNRPASRFSEQLQALEYLVYPYRVPAIGWMPELKALSLADARGFYDAHYGPNNAILVIAGDVSLEQVRRLAEKYYGPIPRRELATPARPAEPPQIAARRLTMSDPEVRQPRWLRSYLAPSSHAGDSGQVVALQVLAEILGGGTTSRLYQTLVVEQKIAAAAGAYYDPDNIGMSQFGLYAVPPPGPAAGAVASLERVEQGVEAVVAALMRDGAGAEEVARAKRGLIAAATYARDSIGGMARVYGAALAIGDSVDDVAAWPQRVAAVTPSDVDAAARVVFRAERSVTGRLLPRLPPETPTGSGQNTDGGRP